MKARNILNHKLGIFVAILIITIVGLFAARPIDIQKKDWTAQQLQQAVIISNLENAKSAVKKDEKEFMKADLRDIIRRVKAETEGKNFQRSYKNYEETINKVINDFNDFEAFLTGLRKLAPGENDLTKLPDENWQEIGVSKTDGDKTLMHLGINVAKSFIVFGNHYRISGGVRGEWTPLDEFEDIAHMMDYIVTVVLVEAHIQPDFIRYFNKSGKQIIVSHEMIRKIALDDLQGRIAKFRGEVNVCIRKINKVRMQMAKLNDKNQKKNLRGKMIALATEQIACHSAILVTGERGITLWHFKPQDLGLTAEEVKILKSGQTDQTEI